MISVSSFPLHDSLSLSGWFLMVYGILGLFLSLVLTLRREEDSCRDELCAFVLNAISSLFEYE